MAITLRRRYRIRSILYIVITICLTILFHNWTKPRHSIVYIKQEKNVKIPFDTKTIKYVPEETIIQNYRSMVIEVPDEEIDWTRLAYVFYATNPDKLVPVLFNVRQLRKLRTKAAIELICSFDYNDELKDQNANKDLTNMIQLLKERYEVNIHIVKPIKSTFTSDSTNWTESFTKLYAFNFTHLDRAVYMDADAMIRKNMDQLFFLPPAMLALPINYIDYKDTSTPNTKLSGKENTLSLSDDLPPSPLEYSLLTQDLYREEIENEEHFDGDYFWSLYEKLPSMELTIDLNSNLKLASYVMVITPDTTIFEWIMKTVTTKKAEEYDMEIINNVWNPTKLLEGNYYIRDIEGQSKTNKWLKENVVPSLLILPHTPYGLLSGEFRHSLFQHSAYLTSANDLWNLKKNKPCLSIQRAVNEGRNYQNIEEIIDTYPEIPYWDWAWRFDVEGRATEELYLDKMEEEMKSRVRKGQADDGLGDVSHLVGVGVDKFGWKSQRVLRDVSYLHWSDWPLNKPWEMYSTEDESNGLMDNVATESLNKCIQDAESIFDSVEMNNAELYTRNKIYFQREREFATKVCHESIDTWKAIYGEYNTLLRSLKQEIENI